MTVVNFADYRKPDNNFEQETDIPENWISGAAMCMACGYHWVQVAPIPPLGIIEGLACPNCDSSRGQFLYPFPTKATEDVLECDTCESVNFHVVLNDGAPKLHCVGCGARVDLNG